MIIKNTITPKRPCANYMSICQNIPFLRIYHKPRSLTRHGQIRIKRCSLAEMDRDNALHYRLDSSLPFWRVCLRSSGRGKGKHMGEIPVFVIEDINCLFAQGLVIWG
ncbi:hypothetical protein ACKS0A_08897 [Histoplasma ohiense]